MSHKRLDIVTDARFGKRRNAKDSDTVGGHWL